MDLRRLDDAGKPLWDAGIIAGFCNRNAAAPWLFQDVREVDSPIPLPVFLHKFIIPCSVYAAATVVIAVAQWPHCHLVPVCRLVRVPWLECVWVQPCVCVAHIPVESWCWGWVLVKDGGLTHSGRLLRNPQAGGMWEAKAKFGYLSVWGDSALFWAKANAKRLRVVTTVALWLPQDSLHASRLAKLNFWN